MAAYFSHLSSPEIEDSAVETIISQATDLCALEQIAALNTSHLSDSSLPTELETRFRKLNSFPVTNPQRRPPPLCLDPEKEDILRSSDRFGINRPISPHHAKPCQPVEPDVVATHEAAILSPAKLESLKDSNPKLRSGFSSPPPISLGSPRGSPSPPRQVCCFGRYSRRSVRKKGKGDGVLRSGLGVGDWGSNDEILSDFSSFSMKDQQRRLKKVLKEQEKASREAEKLVELVKQASARLNVAALDELLSEDEEFK